MLVELGLLGAVATGEACTQVSTCLSMQGPTSGTGDTGDEMGTDSATSTSGPTSTTDVSTSACLSPPDPTLDDSTGVFTTGPCLRPPLDTGDVDSGSGSESGSGSGSESGSGSGDESGSTGMPAPDDPHEIAARVLDSGTLPPDVAERLRSRRPSR